MTNIVSDDELELKISSSEDNYNWLIIEDIDNDEDSENYVAIPKSEKGIESLIKLLEKAKDKLLK
ncbi:MAG: hypothetical protein ABF633_02945 [Clostridium sp.]|uniref:hypothetical protein n=1 Tax=Clostridium sp. TaxID=1506 RepID=UPI0039E7753C